MTELLGGLRKLTEDAAHYMDLITLEDEEIRIELSLVDSEETATLVVCRGIETLEGSEDR